MNYPIRKVAEEVGVSTGTLRRWERLQVLPICPSRTFSNHRLYNERDIKAIKLFLVNGAKEEKNI